jgi:hypothetical protein
VLAALAEHIACGTHTAVYFMAPRQACTDAPLAVSTSSHSFGCCRMPMPTLRPESHG